MNNPDRARALLALADRVCAEEPTIGLAADLFNAGIPVECLTSRDAATAAMPEGLYPVIERLKGSWQVHLYEPIEGEDGWDFVSEAEAPTEPRARTAAALRAMAAEVGNG